MRAKVFVSYKKEDEKYFRKIRKWAINQNFGESDIFMTSSFDKGMRTRTGKLIKGRLEQKIHESKFIIVIVGDENESHPWRKMDEMAVQKNKKRFYMRIPYTSDELPPEFEDFQQLAYNPNAVEKLMRDWVTLYGEDEPIVPYEPKYKPRSNRSDNNSGGYRPRNDNYRSQSDNYRPRNDSYTPRYNRDNRDNSDNRNRDYDRDRPSYNKPYNNDRRYDNDRPSYNKPYNNDRRYDSDRDRDRDRDRNQSSDKPSEKKKYYKRSDRNSSSDKPHDNSHKNTENNNMED